MGYWLDLVRISHNAENLSHLSEILIFSTRKTKKDISHSLLRKWAGGQQLPTANTAKEMTHDLENHWPLRLSFYSARLSMLTLDLALASSYEEISKETALKFLNERLQALLKIDDSIVLNHL